MEKETTILNLRATLDFSNETKRWFLKIIESTNNELNDNQTPWFARDEGKYALQEFGKLWNRILIDETNSEVQGYFKELGINPNFLPQTKIRETYSGSWVIDAAVTIGSSLGGTYAVIKGLSEIPKIAEGLANLKKSIQSKIGRKSNQEAEKILTDQADRNSLPPPPTNTLEIKDFVIDARPILALKPSEMKSHGIHLQCGVSEHAFTMENLSEEMLKDLQIGLFVGKNKRNQWSFGDAYIANINLLSPKQSISKDISEFKHNGGTTLSISDLPVHVDCWIQDKFGIYLFNFYLEE